MAKQSHRKSYKIINRNIGMDHIESKNSVQDKAGSESAIKAKVSTEFNAHIDNKIFVNLLEKTLFLLTREEIEELLRKGVISDIAIIIGTIFSGKFLGKEIFAFAVSRNSLAAFLGVALIIIGMVSNFFLVRRKLKKVEQEHRIEIKIPRVPR
jgi:hypothetical protein